MKTEIKSFYEYHEAICENNLVFMFGTGISASLTGERFGWYKWIADGIACLKDRTIAASLQQELDSDSSADNLVFVVGKVIEAAKADGSYTNWMHTSFETAVINNAALAQTLKKLTVFNDVFVTTNYDRLLERATGLKSLSYEQPDKAFEMLRSGQSDSVLHIHGIYDSVHGIDNIVANKEQYDSVLNDKGAQFIQNILGTRTLVFVGCGKTTEDVNIKQFVEFARIHLKMDRPYYFLFNSASLIEGLPDNIHLIPYGDDYADLPAFLDDLAVERIQHRITGDKIIGRTAFDKKSTSGDSVLNYHFSQRSVPLCGRTEELERLTEFIETDRPFSWWAVTGQAGAGKSRLAFELLGRLSSSWFGFFINEHVLQSDVEGYKPFCNTVVVIDYVAGREHQIAETITGLRRVFAATTFRLRILLLERTSSKSVDSWYSTLLKNCGRTEAATIKEAEYEDGFLCLDDLDTSDVKSLISAICSQHGLKSDPERDEELYEIYSSRFERLRFRPLYVQLFVEAWINNDCDSAKYDQYTDLIEDLLRKEQEKWLASVGNNQSICNACIRLLVRANIAPLRTDNIPDFYKADWEIVKKYIESSSFIGRQKKDFQDTLINSLCQNIDNSHEIIAPQFPDIIKEYMFSYYTEPDTLPEVMKEIWLNAAAPFNTFIIRCLMDFSDQEFYKQALNAYDFSTKDIELLKGKLEFFKNRLIQKGEDPQVFWDLIDNEHVFWSSVVVPEESGKEQDLIATFKVAGLHRVAEHVGAWSLYDVSDMIDVIDEMLLVRGGVATDFIKKFLLSESIRALSTSSFFEASEYLRGKLDELIGQSPEDEFNSLLEMQNSNDKMMKYILSDEFDKAKKVLLEMSHKCRIENLESARMLAHACFNLDTLSFQLNHLGTLGTGLTIVTGIEAIYPQDWTVKARRIGCQVAALQKRFFIDHTDEFTLRAELGKIDRDLATMSFKADDTDEALGMAWGPEKTLWINVATQEELLAILRESNEILKINPIVAEVVCAMIFAVRALHKKYLHTKITHTEVLEIFEHVERNPDSGSIRNEFFSMLEESEDAGKTEEYLNVDIIREGIQDAKYNPLMGSGIPELDLQQALMDEYLTIQEPYVRENRKIGRNEPCPCGSGKKFKQCCLGKGIYD